jgi:hypothetical protein
MTFQQIGDALGVSASTVGYWKTKGCPVRSSLAAIKKWRDEWEASNPRKQTYAADPQLLQLRKALVASQLAESQERVKAATLKRMKEENKLVPIEEARKLIGKFAEKARALALSLPKVRAEAFVGLEDDAAAELALDGFVRDVLAALAGGSLE